MKKDFFLGVQQVKSNPPFQILIDENGHEYKTNEEIASFTTSYYQDLFTIQVETEESSQAKEKVWSAIPRKISPRMNRELTKPISIGELREALKELPAG